MNARGLPPESERQPTREAAGVPALFFGTRNDQRIEVKL